MSGFADDYPEAMRSDLRGLKPYRVEKPEVKARLDANESPYDLPAALKERLARRLLETPLNRYPDSGAAELKEALARRLGADPAQIAVGNGSDELIAALILAVAAGREDARVIAPSPTFSMYRILSQASGARFESVPLTADFELDEAAMQAAVSHGGWSLVFLSYPNNPTGNCWDRGVIRRLAAAERAVLVLDEAYAEFSGKTFAGELDALGGNALVLRTFSKAFGLAGLRVGYMAADPRWVACVDRVRLPYNLNGFSQAAALELAVRRGFAESRVEAILRERDRVASALDASDRYEPFPTDANFVLFRALEGADAVFERALADGVLLRNLSKPGPLENCLRATIGSPAENGLLLRALRVSPDAPPAAR